MPLTGVFYKFMTEIKYFSVILNSRFTWKPHIIHAIQKFHKAKTDLAHFLYSKDGSLKNKILLYNSILKPILLHAAPVWGLPLNHISNES